jgi:uncharacterized protein (TIGR02145 family)
MFNRRISGIIIFCLAVSGPVLFSQITLEGVVKDNGAEAVVNALVELTDQSDPGRYFSDTTDKEGRYSIRIDETGTHDVRPGVASLFELSQNYPNPFNPSTVITFEITRPAAIRLTIHDILGRKIRTLFDGFHSGLSGRIVWDATDDGGRGVPAGIYIYSLSMEGIGINRKMLLMDGCTGLSNPGLSKQARTGTAPGKKTSDEYRLRVTGPDVEIHEQQNIRITENTVLDVIVFRTVTDTDGHIYRTVKIDDLWWMAENLKVTHYRNGEAIPAVADKTAWSTLTTGAICEYENDSFNSSFYGYLYNWHAANDDRGVAPMGWHVPGDAEWRKAVDFLGGDAVAGGKMKETGTAHWISPNAGATDESGFSAAPAGFRDNGGIFGEMGRSARFWSSVVNGGDDALYYGLNAGDPEVTRGDASRLDGFSIRCVKGFGTVAAPAFSPSPGTYTTAQHVTIVCSTPEATIHYTTDGSDPTENDTTFSGGAPVALSGTTMLKARAYRTDWTASGVAGGVYTITGTVAAPAFDPPPGVYPAAQNVTIICSTPEASIHYTMNGADPEESDSTCHGPVSIAATATLKARAYKTGWNPSDAAAGVYTITGTVATPTFSPSSGTYASAVNVAIACPTPGAAIHYTTDGADPDESDPAYNRPIPIADTTTLKARAYKTGWIPSDMDSATYSITGKVVKPAFSPSPGLYPAAQSVIIVCPTPEAAVHYTRNGADPDESDSTYGNPVSITGTTVLKARAYRTGWNPSPVESGTYTINGSIAAPEFSPLPGTYPTARKITITCPTFGTTIHFTTNGVNPTEAAPTYTGPVYISHTTVLKARAYRSGWNPSSTAAGEYTMNTTTVYCMGNSITASGRYENVLNGLLGDGWGVVNLGISGQTTAQMLTRFNHDVIAPGDAKYVIVLGGVNDVRYSRTAAQIESDLQSMYTAAHNAGIKVVAVSILPFKNFTGGKPWTPEKQVVLDEVNAWISAAAVNVDYKVNVYKALEDPANPDCLSPAYDDGDGLHPNYAAHIVLANAIYHTVSWSH